MTQKEGYHEPSFHRFRGRTASSSRGRRGAAIPRSRQCGPGSGAQDGRHKDPRHQGPVAAAVDGRRGSRRAVGRCLVWLGLLDRRPLSRLDRRRLCKGRQHDHRAKGLGLPRPRCWSATTSTSRPARCWRASTTATSRWRSTRPRPTWPRRRRPSPASSAQLDVQQAVIEAAKATRRGRHRRQDLRRPGEQALHRSCRHRLWQRAERAGRAIAQCRRGSRDRSATRPISSLR